MKKQIFFSLLALSMTVPAAAEAFTPTSITQYRFSATHALYEVAYTFGSNTEPVHLPIFGTLTPKDTEFGFRVRRNNEYFIPVSAIGFVIASTSIENQMYVVEPGTSVDFTAYVLVEVPDAPGSEAYHIEFTALPFKEGEPRRNTPMLNESQLERFVTGKVAL